MKTRFLVPIITVTFVLLFGCATTYLKVPVQKPANINLAGIKKIAIGEITGNGAGDFSDELTAKLFESDRFDVLDRQHFNDILQEHKLTYSGLMDDSTTAEIGKLLGSAALIFGRVSNYDYNEETTYDTYNDKEGRSHRSYTRKGTASVSISLQITDLRTGKIIAVRKLNQNVEEKTRATDKTPAGIDKNHVLADARNRILKTFMRDIAPYTVTEKVKLLSDKNVPLLEQGINMIKVGEWEQGIEYFVKAEKEAPINSKVFFNLGVAYTMTSQFDQAISSFEKAYSLEPKQDYAKELAHCKALQKDHEKLQKQLKDAGI